MEPKHELIVFSKREIFIVLLLFVLVALASFTLGLKLGRNMILPEAAVKHGESPIHTEKALEEPPIEHHEGESEPSHEDTSSPGAQLKPGEHTGVPPGTHPEDKVADAELEKELGKKEVKTKKIVAMDMPSQKATPLAQAQSSKFTIQVGAHRTVAEAAEQVVLLKKSDLDAFYIEAKIPGRGTWYRVGIGVYPTKEIAEKSSELLKEKHHEKLPPFIVQKIGSGE